MNQQFEGSKAFFTVLMAEDDSDDRFLMEEVFKELRSEEELRFVENGEELMDYLTHRGKYADPKHAPQPSLILLDLNMPRKDGRQALAEIRAIPGLEKIPIVIWTTSDLEEDRIQCEKEGANSYVIKPAGYAELVRAVRDLTRQWIERSHPE